jgi:hypothetical protein
MFGVITFKIKTKGKYTKDGKEEITYTSDAQLPASFGSASLGSASLGTASQGSIFITPSVKFSKKLSYDNDDYKNVLTSYEKFKQFVKESIEKNGETPIEDKETIISNLNFNINFIKNIFFPQKSTFKIKDDRYSVDSSSYIDGQYEISDIKKSGDSEDKIGIDTNLIDKKYIAHIELTLSPFPVISGLQFRIKTTKFKQLEKREKYDSMPDPAFMFITPSVKLTMNDLHYSYINGDYKKLLTSYSDFSALVDYIATKQEILDKRDPDYEKKLKEILNNNIKLIKNIFFPDKSKYSYRNQKFVIAKSNYIDNDYETNTYNEYKNTDNYKALAGSNQAFTSINQGLASINQGLASINQVLASKVKVIYIGNLELTFLDIPVGSEQPSQQDFNRLSCSEKAKELENQFMYYFDVSLNLFEKPKQTIVIKSEYDKAREKLEIENKKRKDEEEKKKEDIIRKNLEEKERFLYLKKRDDERKKKEDEELKKKQQSELKVGGKKKSKKVGLYKIFKKNVSRKR